MNRNSPYLTLLSALLFSVAGVSNAENYVLDFNEQPRSCVAHSESDWGYYGQVSNPRLHDRKPILLPLDWGRQFEDCGHMYAPMHRQSPIELPTVADEMPPETKAEIVFGHTALSLDRLCQHDLCPTADQVFRTVHGHGFHAT